jgi:hypothetical protein
MAVRLVTCRLSPAAFEPYLRVAYVVQPRRLMLAMLTHWLTSLPLVR